METSNLVSCLEGSSMSSGQWVIQSATESKQVLIPETRLLSMALQWLDDVKICAQIARAFMLYVSSLWCMSRPLTPPMTGEH